MHKGWFLWPAHSGIDKSTTSAARRALHRTYDPSVQRPEGRCDHAGWHAPAAQLGGYPLRSRARAKQEPVLSGLSRGVRSGLAGWQEPTAGTETRKGTGPRHSPSDVAGCSLALRARLPSRVRSSCVAQASGRKNPGDLRSTTFLWLHVYSHTRSGEYGQGAQLLVA